MSEEKEHYFASCERRWGECLKMIDEELFRDEGGERTRLLQEVRRDVLTARYLTRKLIAQGDKCEKKLLFQYGKMFEQNLVPKLKKLGYL